MKKQAGFTLIELVVVLVILGIMAAVAMPKFVDLKDEASQGAVDSVAGALSSAAAINYAARKAGKTTGTVAFTNCQDASGLLNGGLPDTDYTITSLALTSVASDTPTTCTLNGKNSKSATFIVTKN